MITEDYVSYEVAKLLKEKGFDVPCLACWYIGSEAHEKFSDYPFNWNEVKSDVDWLSRSTNQMAMKWLRKKYGLHIDVTPYLNEEGEATWVWEIINVVTATIIADSLDLDDDFSSCEEAVDIALKYCLTKLI